MNSLFEVGDNVDYQGDTFTITGMFKTGNDILCGLGNIGWQSAEQTELTISSWVNEKDLKKSEHFNWRKYLEK